MLDTKAFTIFTQSLRGTVIQPGDAAYEEARKLYDGMIDKRPRIIARCAGVADVIAAVNFGREHDLLSRYAAAVTTAPVSEAATMDWSSTCP